MSSERPIRRSNQEVFFTEEQAELQASLRNIFDRSSRLFSIAQNLFPESKMIPQADFNVPHKGYSQLGHTFTFNFGVEEPRSISVYGERDYILDGVYPRFVDDFFRFTFRIPLGEEELKALDHNKLLIHTPRFFVQRDDLGGFESGVSWVQKKPEDNEGMERPRVKTDLFQAPLPFLDQIYKSINRPVTGINTLVINQEMYKQMQQGIPMTESILYPDTKIAKEE